MVDRFYKGIYKAMGLMVSEKKSFYAFPIASLWELMTLRVCQFGPQGHYWQDLCWVPPNMATY